MSQNLKRRQRTGPVLRPQDIQIIHLKQRMNLLQETLQTIREALRTAERIGADEDVPEGSRYIQLSDTLANRLCEVTDP